LRTPHACNITVNINDYVKVKLNQTGKDIYFHRHDDTRRKYVEENGYYPVCFQPEFPKVDENGYSKFPLWEFMKLYSDYMDLGKSLPFDTELIFE